MVSHVLDSWQVERARRLSILTRLLYVCGSIVLVLGALLVALVGGFDARIQLTLIELAGLFVGILIAWGLAYAKQLEAGSHLSFRGAGGRNICDQLAQMSAPILPVADAVLALPLVGALDSRRAALLTERLLEAIGRERARMVLIDITGVPLVDTEVAGALIRAAQAVRLLGAEPVLVGVRAEVAQMLVALGVDLGDLISLRDMRSGLAYAFQQLEMRDWRSDVRTPQSMAQR